MMRNLLALLAMGHATVACAQGLDRRLAAARGDQVQLTLPARASICGDGRSYIRLEGDAWIGTMNDATRWSPCETGPARVVVSRAEGEIVRIDTYVGPAPTNAGEVTDLGRVAPAEAAAWLATLARSGEGRVARDAMLPLGIIDSAAVTPTLNAMVDDRELPRDTRRSALSWTVRRRMAADGLAPAALAARLSRLASDDTEHSSLRQSAVGHLARLERGEGIPALVTMTEGQSDGWLARQAAEALGRHGDPRARRAVRAIIADADRPAEVRAAAIQGLAGEYGTVKDAEALIAAWPQLGTDGLRDAALGTMASLGGSASRAFLLKTVRDEAGASRQRRRAAGLLERVGVPAREVVSLYDGVSDGEVRAQLIELLAQAGTREAVAKLLRIAKEDTQPTARRRAIAALGKRDDPAVREALRSIVGS
ncbi:MAG: HEAT repeat domain-containing protein [Gemmatimonadetes bacterium]|nr:HEAT repeat domain-containing protein [Gemmatimonadota bacterium]